MDEPRGARADARRPGAPGSGAAAARSTGARARRRATASTCATRATTATWTCCCSSSSRRAGAPATPASAAASSGRSATAPRPARCDERPAGSRRRRRRRSRALAREYTVVPVWREVLADLETPLSAFVEARRRPRGLPARVGRARRAVGPLLVPRSRSRAHVRRARAATSNGSAASPPDGVPSDQGTLAALDALLEALPRARRSPSCRRSTAASSAGSATTPCARSSGSRRRLPTTSGCPTRCARSPAGRRVRPLPPAAAS